MERRNTEDKVRICAVSYLNSVPLVWGLLHDPKYQRQYDITFHVPSGTAEILKSGESDVGIVSSIELPRQKLDYVQGLGIASFGAVRSILLITSKPISEIQSLAVDSSSRTSTALCRIVLLYRFGRTPDIVPMPPDLQKMLRSADAALIIGDPALHLEPSTLPYAVYDLGEEWMKMTGLPMVYAVWGARKGAITALLTDALFESYHFGRDHVDDIVKSECKQRGFSESLARDYLTHNIKYELGPEYSKGLELYLEYATALRLI